MAKDFMAQMLDELMGRNRNAAPNEKQELNFDDDTVCKHYLACYCPNELFTNTKADLGVCKLIHDEELKSQYQASPKFQQAGYEESFLRFLRGMIQDVDRRIDRGKGRLDVNKQAAMTNPGNKYDEKIRELSQKIEELVKEAEQLGFQGRVDEAQQKLRLSDQMRKDRDGIRATLELAVQQEKQLEVCQICGAFLIVGDAQQRLDDHLSGKQHVGYAKIRETVAEEEAKLAKRMEERRMAREASSGSRGKVGKEEEKPAGNGRDQNTRDRVNRSRSRDRNKRRRSRSVERYKRRRSRSVSRERRRRRSPSDDRRGNRNNRRQSRSRDDRRRRSRDRDSRSKKDDDKRRRRRSSSSSDSSKSRKRKETVPEARKSVNGSDRVSKPREDVRMQEGSPVSGLEVPETNGKTVEPWSG